MLKKSVQQGRSEEGPEAYPLGYVEDPERCENAAGGLFQHPAKTHILLPMPSVECYSRGGHEVISAFPYDLLALWINLHNTPPR